jgi:hypothetical protein
MKITLAVMMTALAVMTSKGVDGGGLFKGREVSLSVFGGWVDKDDSKVAPGIGISYFLTRHFGIGAMTHWDNYDGKFIDNISGEAYFRLPLGRMPLAPYGVAAFGYSFETEETFESLGAGAEWRFTRKWGAFGDVRWQFNNDNDDGVAIRVGARLLF